MSCSGTLHNAPSESQTGGTWLCPCFIAESKIIQKKSFEKGLVIDMLVVAEYGIYLQIKLIKPLYLKENKILAISHTCSRILFKYHIHFDK